MKVLEEEISANGHRRLIITLNNEELQLLYGIVKKAYLHTPKIPATDIMSTRLRSMRTDLGQFIRKMKDANINVMKTK